MIERSTSGQRWTPRLDGAMYEGLLAGTVRIEGHQGDVIDAHMARPPSGDQALEPAENMEWWDALPAGEDDVAFLWKGQASLIHVWLQRLADVLDQGLQQGRALTGLHLADHRG